MSRVVNGELIDKGGRADHSTQSGSSGRLLDAAMAAFAELGFHGTTTREITRRAGMSPGALYMHFDSKAAMLFKIVESTHVAVLNDIRRAAAQPGTARERLGNVVQAHVEFNAAARTACRIANYELHSLAPDEWAQISKLRQETDLIVRKIVDEIIAQDEIHIDPAIMTIAVLSLGIDVSRWSRPTGRLSPRQLGEQYRKVIEKMFADGGRRAKAATGKPPRTKPRSGKAAPAVSDPPPAAEDALSVKRQRKRRPITTA